MAEGLLSFNLSSDFAIFKDESITTSNTSYVIPPKTTLIGLIAGILGINRGNLFRKNTIDNIYPKEYLELFKAIKIGIKVLNNDISKTVFFTNNLSLKKRGGKPFKKELFVNPNYEIFIFGEDNILKKLYNNILNSEYKYTPFLGNAYCLAKIKDPKFIDFMRCENVKDKLTSGVIIGNNDIILNPINESSNTVIIENHLNIFFNDNDEIKKEIVSLWAPLGCDQLRISRYEKRSDIIFLELSKNEVVCVY